MMSIVAPSWRHGQSHSKAYRYITYPGEKARREIWVKHQYVGISLRSSSYASLISSGSLCLERQPSLDSAYGNFSRVIHHHQLIFPLCILQIRPVFNGSIVQHNWVDTNTCCAPDVWSSSYCLGNLVYLSNLYPNLQSGLAGLVLSSL